MFRCGLSELVWTSDLLVNCYLFKQKAAYEGRMRDCSSDVCSSDLIVLAIGYVRDCEVGDCNTQPQRQKWSGMENHRQYQSFNQVRARIDQRQEADRHSVVSGKSVSVRVDLSGRSCINKKHE